MGTPTSVLARWPSLTLEYEDIPDPVITRGHELEGDQYVEAIRSVVTELAAAGNVVIVGRGSAMILEGFPGVLRVGSVAHMKDRITRTVQLERIDHGEAEKLLLDRDAARNYFYQRYLGVDDPDDPLHYHLVVNTSEVDIDFAVDTVVGSVEALENGRLKPRLGAEAN